MIREPGKSGANQERREGARTGSATREENRQRAEMSGGEGFGTRLESRQAGGSGEGETNASNSKTGVSSETKASCRGS